MLGGSASLRLRTQGDFQWHGQPDPVSVETCSCAQTYSQRGISGLCTKQIVNLQGGVEGHFAPNAVCRRSLPCVGVVNERSGRDAPAGAVCGPLLSETIPAKEAKRRTDCGGNHLGCSYEAEKGLQCGLSGSRVARMATPCRGVKGETASIGNERCAAGKTNPYLSRKIYFFCRRLLSDYQLTEV